MASETTPEIAPGFPDTAPAATPDTGAASPATAP
ncbi:2-C-methyl-D-erythritol 2,4-cyclodiphosphate synthase, partial [Streptomyces sp. SID625]|nr:2-C-methyl-D-erythritol 2,4-cyclodiphosphate synthase [Streptomyces sp. SID625]